MVHHQENFRINILCEKHPSSHCTKSTEPRKVENMWDICLFYPSKFVSSNGQWRWMVCCRRHGSPRGNIGIAEDVHCWSPSVLDVNMSTARKEWNETIVHMALCKLRLNTVFFVHLSYLYEFCLVVYRTVEIHYGCFSNALAFWLL